MRVGKFRWALEKMLAKKGFMIRASEIRQNAPAYRRITSDGIAWEVYAQVLGGKGHVQLHSWDTMKECVKEGITVRKVSQGMYEVSADADSKTS